MDRRQFLKTLAAGMGAVLSDATRLRALADMPAGAFSPPAAVARDPVSHVISRLTFGVTPELYAHVRAIGVDAFIEEQLAPQTIDDSAVEPHLSQFSSILWQNGGLLAREYGSMQNVVSNALIGSWTVRGVYSKRQLYERMVHFFSDHFNIFVGKDPLLFLKVDDDRSVIRPHAMGTFRDMLWATAHSPAMLVYLDNVLNHRSGPNENYARELLELHTLGLNGGYTENDVKEIARCFTGWSVSRARETESGAIVFVYRDRSHDNRRKTVLGSNIPRGGGKRDGEAVLDLLARHPSTARFISTKLVRRFVSDNPPPALVDACAQTFLDSGGRIPDVLRTIFRSDEFWNAPPKFKQPYEYILSLLRAMAFEIGNPRQFVSTVREPLSAMGHVPFTWPTPDGFPDYQLAWQANLLPRWNAAIMAAGGEAPGANAGWLRLLQMFEANGVPLEVEPVISFMGGYLFGRELTPDELTTIVPFARSVPGTEVQQIIAGLALMLASPAFQYR